MLTFLTPYLSLKISSSDRTTTGRSQAPYLTILGSTGEDRNNVNQQYHRHTMDFSLLAISQPPCHPSAVMLSALQLDAASRKAQLACQNNNTVCTKSPLHFGSALALFTIARIGLNPLPSILTDPASYCFLLLTSASLVP